MASLADQEQINGAELARRLGVSRMAVTYAKQQDRLTSAIVPGGGKRLKYYWPAVRDAWAENADTRFHPKVTASDQPRTPSAEPAPQDQQTKTPEQETDGVPSRARSQQVEAVYKARMARLEYEERAGKLISVDRVRAEQFRFGRVVRDMVLNIPTRCAHELAGALGREVKPAEVHAILDKIMREVLQEAVTGNGAPGDE